MISQDFILLILNCKAYRHKATLQRKLWVNNLPCFIKHFYIIGDETLIDDYMFWEDTLYVKCKDDYLSLPIKIMSAIKAISKVYNYKYIFKTDDDQMLVNKNFFTQLCDELVNRETYDYGGFIVDVKDHYTEYKSSQIQKKIKLNACRYANGRFYLLSKKSCDHLLSVSHKFYDYIYEDYSIGYELSNAKDLKIKMLDSQFDDFMDIDIYINNKYHIYMEGVTLVDKTIEAIKNYRKNNKDIILNVYITFNDSKYFESKLTKEITEKVEFHAVSEKVKNKAINNPNYAYNVISASVIRGCKNMDKYMILINTDKISLNMIHQIVIEMEKGFDVVCGKEHANSFICLSPSIFTDENVDDLSNNKTDIYDLVSSVLAINKNVKVLDWN